MYRRAGKPYLPGTTVGVFPDPVAAALLMPDCPVGPSIRLITWDHRKGQTVRKLSILLVALLAVALAATVATAAKKPIAFVGKYTGTATTQGQDANVTITANGTGKGTLVGSGKVTGAGTADSTQRPCVPFLGTGKMSGAGGAIVFKVKPASSGCGDDSGNLFSISGKVVVVKATGKLAKAKGTLKMTGTYDRSSGAFSVKFSGALTK